MKFVFDILLMILFFQPMEIYVDDEAKLTLHGLVQVCLVDMFFYSPLCDD